RGVKLSRLFAGVCCELRDQVFVDEPKHVVALSAIGGNVINKVEQILNRLSLRGRATTQIRQTCFQRAEDVVEHMGTARQDETVECRKRITYISDIEVTACSAPRRVEVAIRDEVAQTVLHKLHCFRIIFDEHLSKLIGFYVVGVHQLLNLIREELIEDEAENVVL